MICTIITHQNINFEVHIVHHVLSMKEVEKDFYQWIDQHFPARPGVSESQPVLAYQLLS